MPEKPRPVDQSISDVPTATPPVGQTPVFRSPAGPSTTEAATRVKPAVSPLRELQPGLIVAGRYAIEEKLGEGGMGLVFRALDTELKRQVVLKFVRPDLAAREDIVQRLFEEALAAAALNHPHVVTVHNRESDPVFGRFLVLEYVAGPNLQQLLEQHGGPLPVERAVRYIGQIGAALQAAHDKGIVHRDVKPSNILIAPGDHAKLADFGIARLSETEGGGLTQTGAALGTLDFMAPEQIVDPRNASPRSDQYSLAATLYQLITDESPKVMDLELVPDLLRLVLRQALRRIPGQRFDNLHDFCQAIRPEESVERSEPARPVTRPNPDVPDAPRRSSEPPQESVNIAGLIEQMRRDARSAEEQARAAMARQSFAEAVEILESVKASEFLDRTLVEDVRAKHAAAEAEAQKRRKEAERRQRRVAELNAQINAAVTAHRLSSLSVDVVDELLKLEPDRSDLRTLRATLEELAIAPRVHVGASGKLVAGTQAGERWSFQLGGQEYAFRWCPAGKFTMGDGKDSDNKPVSVELSRGFWLQETEVTQGMWRAVMGTTPWQGQSYVKKGDRIAASYVTWADAQEFCGKLTALARQSGVLGSTGKLVLPNEAQWEYACRAGTTTRFSFGDEETKLSEYAWWGGIVGNGNCVSEQYAHEVGQKKGNPWGLFDLHGNVWEWCADWYHGSLAGGRDPVGPSSGFSRVCRGGSWYYRGAPYCRSAYRRNYDPLDRGGSIGFRVLSELRG